MKYVNIAFGWVWRRKVFFGTMLASAVLFFVWIFPFSDLSQLVTTQVAQATNNQIYVQSETLDLHLLPTPAISAAALSIETTLPPLEAKWAKVTPSLFSVLFNIRSLMKMQTEPEVGRAALARVGISIDAEDVLGADVDLSMGPGKKSDSGKERSRVSLAIENLNLGRVQDWADLPVKMQGTAALETDVLFSPDFQEQPDGEILLKVSKFNLPASTVMVPMEGASMPVNLPALTLANVVVKGRMAGGQLIIEEGTFGQSSDPLNGRIKGQLGLRLQPAGTGVYPVLGSYNLTVDLNATRAIQKEIGIAFLLFDSAKTDTPSGFRYLFRAQGNGMAGMPSITRLTSF